MNDCMYEAAKSHMAWLGIGLRNSDFDLYLTLKKMYMNDVNAPLWGGAVPTIVSALAGAYGLGRRLEYDVWTPAHYEAAAETWLLKSISRRCWLGATEGITLAPAIYLLLDARHAVFAEQKPPGLVVAAIQLIKKGFNDD